MNTSLTNLVPPVWDKTAEGTQSFYDFFTAFVAAKVTQKSSFAWDIVIDALQKNVTNNSVIITECTFQFKEEFEQLDDDEQYESDLYDVISWLREEELELSGITLPIEGEGEFYKRFFSLFRSVGFSDCDFHPVNDKSTLQLYDPKCHFTNCQFKLFVDISDFSYFESKKFLFDDCSFDNPVVIKHGRFDANDDSNEYCADSIYYPAIFNNCKKIFELRICGLYDSLPLFNISGTAPIKLRKLVFENCKFLSDLSFKLEVELLELKNVIFNQLVSFDGSSILSANFREVAFNKAVSFNACKFGCDTSEGSQPAKFDYVEFVGFANFRNVKFFSELDIVNTKFHNQPNFLKSEFYGIAKPHTNRETFRIIKHSFQSVGNHVEANRFFSHEMSAYRRELADSNEKGARRERVLVSLNGWISDHGQNYLLAAVWWCLLVILIALVFMNHHAQWVPTHFAGPTWWQYFRDAVNGLAKGFLPLHSVYKHYPGFEAFVLFSTIALSGVTWHLLVALRRHSKK